MLPFEIPGGRDDAAMAAPVFLKCRFCPGGFDTRVHDRMLDLGKGVAPEHGENHFSSVSISCDHWSDVRRPDFSAGFDRLFFLNVY